MILLLSAALTASSSLEFSALADSSNTFMSLICEVKKSLADLASLKLTTLSSLTTTPAEEARVFKLANNSFNSFLATIEAETLFCNSLDASNASETDDFKTFEPTLTSRPASFSSLVASSTVLSTSCLDLTSASADLSCSSINAFILSKSSNTSTSPSLTSNPADFSFSAFATAFSLLDF